MSQNDMVIANSSGALVRADLNSALQALASTSKGSSAPSTQYAGQPWLDDNTPSSTLWTEFLYDGADNIPVKRVDVTANRSIPYNAAHGQCRLAKSGSNLVLSPFNGNVLVINGAPEVIPSAGVSLAPTALTPGTTYFVYAYMSSGTMTLEASTTGHATDSTTGVETKSGDATRTLVGMARIVTGPAWADSATQRFVLSWFNQKRRAGKSNFTANRTTTGTSYAEINSEIRVEFLTWGSTEVDAHIVGAVNNSGTGFSATALSFDGSTAEDGFNYAAPGSNLTTGVSVRSTNEGLSEGYHYATLFGKVNTGTATWLGASAGSVDNTSLRVSVLG